MLLVGEYTRTLSDGRVLTPSLELGGRYDGGDGITGSGVELGSGLRYSNPTSNLTVEGKVRALLAHDYDEWGADFVMRLSPKSGRGLSLKLHPEWGKTQSVAERLWNDGSNEITTTGVPALQSSLDTEIGYGVSASMLGTSGLLTPYIGMTSKDGGTSHLRLGARFLGGTGLSLNLEGVRGNAADGGE